MNLVILTLTFCYCVLSKEIPSYVHLCKANDPNLGDCFTKAVYELMPHLIQGIPEMDLPPIDPLPFSSIKINTGNTGSVRMDIDLFNGTASGLKNLKIENHKVDFENLNFTSMLIIPEINIEATYKVNGQILLFEIHGTGHASFNASELRTQSVWLANTYKKKGKTHLSVDDVQFNAVELKGMRIRLDNLFGENNEVLTDNVNNAINENIDSLKVELEPIFKETIAAIIRTYFDRVYRLFSRDELYLPD